MEGPWRVFTALTTRTIRAACRLTRLNSWTRNRVIRCPRHPALRVSRSEQRSSPRGTGATKGKQSRAPSKWQGTLLRPAGGSLVGTDSSHWNSADRLLDSRPPIRGCGVGWNCINHAIGDGPKVAGSCAGSDHSALDLQQTARQNQHKNYKSARSRGLEATIRFPRGTICEDHHRQPVRPRFR